MALHLLAFALLASTCSTSSNGSVTCSVETDKKAVEKVTAETKAELQRAEAAAQKDGSPLASDDASAAAINFGRVDRGTMWIVETLARKVRRARPDKVDQVRGYGLMVLVLHLEAFSTQLTRELLRGVQDGTGLAHAQSLATRCGKTSAASRALVAAVADAKETLTLPRNVTAEFIAHCAVTQSAAKLLIDAGASGSIRHVGGYTILHLLAMFGSSALVTDVVNALPKEVVSELLETVGGSEALRPHELARMHQHDECAAVLVALSKATAAGKAAGEAEKAAAPEEEAIVGAVVEEEETGGWSSSVGGLAAGETSPSSCDLPVEYGPSLDLATFSSRYLIPSRPVLIRNGTLTASWRGLREMLSKDALVGTYGELKVEVGAAPYYEAAAKRSMSLREYAEIVASSGGGGDDEKEEGEAAAGSDSDTASRYDYLFLGLTSRSNDVHEHLETRLAEHLPDLITEALRNKLLHYRASMQFYLGPKGSGSPPHYHMAAVNTLVYGRKRWHLIPPRDAVYSALPARQWHRSGGPARLRGEGRAVYECVQRPGDVLFVPDNWGHAVLNLAPSVGFASEVATARGASLRMEIR